MKLYEIIKSLQDAKGSKIKQAILDSHKDDELLREYMRATYDPAINYYQTKLPKVSGCGKHELCVETLGYILDTLSQRKLTGGAAIAYLKAELERLDTESQELLGYIIKRSIGASVGETMVLKTWSDLFFIPPYMRCAGMDEKVLAHYTSLPFFYVQTKMDGQFGYLSKSRIGGSGLFSRAGSFYPMWLAEKLAEGVPIGYVLMGELLVYSEDVLLDRKTGNGILNSLLSGEGSKFNSEIHTVKYVAWDMVTEEEFDVAYSQRPYTERLSNLDDITEYRTPHISLVAHYNVTSTSQAFAINTKKLLTGEEGTVWKDPNGIWRDTSSGTKDAVKAKVKFQAEYIVTGKYEGEGKAAGMLGGFHCESADGRIKFSVGSGFDDKQRAEYWAADTDRWIITVEANDVITKKGSDTESLFLPIFIEPRPDRKEADSRERILQQLQSAKMGQ